MLKRFVLGSSKNISSRWVHDSKTCPSFDFNVAKRENIRSILSFGPSAQLFKVYGWARKIQRQKLTSFVHLDDGSGQRLQLVINNQMVASNDIKLSNGVALECTGRLVPSSGPKQDYEFACDSVQVVGECDPATYSISHLNEQFKMDYLRERIHLRPRVRYFQSILRIRCELLNAIQIFMKQNDFVHVHTPMITTNDCEGGGECFTIKPLNWNDSLEKTYFGRPTYLTVSGQLHLEALASSLSRVYTLGPVFRAEKSMSPKHLSEFYMLEVEECFIFDLKHLLDRVEALCKFLIFYIQTHCEYDWNHLLKHNNYDLVKQISDCRYIRMTYLEAIELLEKTDMYKDIRKNSPHPALNNSMEQTLLKLMDNVPIFITHFPFAIKSFYMKSDYEERALCFDLLFPICGEVCGGSLREDNLEKLKINIKRKQIVDTNLDWYLDIRRFGYAPSGGFGVGFDRFIQSLTGIENIKDVVTFPRWPYHCHL